MPLKRDPHPAILYLVKAWANTTAGTRKNMNYFVLSTNKENAIDKAESVARVDHLINGKFNVSEVLTIVDNVVL